MALSKPEVQSYFGQCKCCLNYAYLKNMWEQHLSEGAREIYGKMLVDCFSISWTIRDKVEEDKICEECIMKLRNAISFKNLLLNSQNKMLQSKDEKNFKMKSPDRPIYSLVEPDVIRVEPEPLKKKDLGEQNNFDDGDVEFLEEEEEEPVEIDDLDYRDPLPVNKDQDGPQSCEQYKEEMLNNAVKAVTARGLNLLKAANKYGIPKTTLELKIKELKRKEKSDDSGPERKKLKNKVPKKEKALKVKKNHSVDQLNAAVEAVLSKKIPIIKAALTYKVPRKILTAKLKEMSGDDYDESSEDSETEHEEDETNYHKELILNKHRENIQSILLSSNATPIKGHWGIGYACYFCPQQFTDPLNLKMHSFEHQSQFSSFKIRAVEEHIVKLDVTGLKCSICNVNIESLESLMVHIKTIHELPMHLDIPNHIVPFKFDSGMMNCVKCTKQFSLFKNLSEHMNDVHFRNYECNKCPRGFVNIRSLKTHSIRHRVGIFACSFCPKVFDTKIKVLDHERVTHRLSHKTRKCSYCDEKFIDQVKKTAHEIDIHGKEKAEHKCGACSKVFDNARALLTHINAVHLLHRPHKCDHCESTYFLKHELKNHILKKHSDNPHSFQCSVCSKIYSTKKALKEHMFKHSDERKYRCEVCGSRFFAEENYSMHMKNKHGLE